MGYDLVVIFKNKNKVKYGSRSNPIIIEKDIHIQEYENINKQQNHKYDSYFHLHSDWWKSDIETWPDELQLWYYHINTPDDAKEHAKLFRKYYDNDIRNIHLKIMLLGNNKERRGRLERRIDLIGPLHIKNSLLDNKTPSYYKVEE